MNKARRETMRKLDDRSALSLPRISAKYDLDLLWFREHCYSAVRQVWGTIEGLRFRPTPVRGLTYVFAM